MLADSEQTTPELSEYEKDRLAWNLPHPVNEPRPARPRLERGREVGPPGDEASHSEAA